MTTPPQDPSIPPHHDQSSFDVHNLSYEKFDMPSGTEPAKATHDTVDVSNGSKWRKWDLHIHTPASYQWIGQQFKDMNLAEIEESCKTIFDKFNELDIDAFCIMDYWTFDGYLKLRDYQRKNPGVTQKMVFPGIELRAEAPTDFQLNTHFLLDSDLSDAELNAFLHRLRLSDGGAELIDDNFVRIGKGYTNPKLEKHGFKETDKQDDDKMGVLGRMTATVTLESIQAAMEAVGRNRCLLIQPYDTHHGLEDLKWDKHPYADSQLMKMADIFEAKSPRNINLFLGKEDPKNPDLSKDFIATLGGHPKPVVRGSDAHKVSEYGKYPGNRITWLKAQPTFAGLRQVCHEPAGRCFIGEEPRKRLQLQENPTKHVRYLEIKKRVGSDLVEHWFDGISLDVNPGLVAIIGNKGSGKSAMADILALAGNTHCAEMEFLTNERFRRGENKAASFEVCLTWADGSENSVTLDQDPNLNMPERVRYLPQQYIEKLCNEIATKGETHFEQELKKVIFLHVSHEDRLGKGDLNDLIDFRIDSKRNSIEQSRQKIHEINKSICALELQMSEDSVGSITAELNLKMSELEAHKASEPKEPEKLSGDQDVDEVAAAGLENVEESKEKFQAQLKSTRERLTQVTKKKAIYERLIGLVSNHQRAHESFLDQHADEFTIIGLDVNDIVRVDIQPKSLHSGVSECVEQISALTVKIDGTHDQDGLVLQISKLIEQAKKNRNDLAAPQQQYQQFLLAKKKWILRASELAGDGELPGTIKYLENRLNYVSKQAPIELGKLKEQRLELVKEIHEDLVHVREVYESLYEPVQQIAEHAAFSDDGSPLEFNAYLSPSSFEEDFLDFIHKNRRGNFHGDDDSKLAVRRLVGKNQFSSAEKTVKFIEELMSTLTTFDGNDEQLKIASQLRDNKSVSDLYDFVFGLNYIEPRYTLKLGDKELAELSPGEKGGLLLVFYLLLDKDRVPIIIDQPEQNLDNQSVVRMLVDCIRQATQHRQVFIVTHNPNLAVVCDADQVICMSLSKADGNRVTCESGAIEDGHINECVVDVLEGTFPAFDNRRKKYHRPTNH